MASELTVDKNVENNLLISDSAKNQIALLLLMEAKETGKADDSFFFRVAIDGGGCSGFQYMFTFDDKIQGDDKQFGTDSARVVVDETSLGLLGGSVLDYSEDLGEAGFKIKNPNATAGCGCGNSFAV
jgi:iron-sulfur cluster insertion protein